jgi:hypothetical protein
VANTSEHQRPVCDEWGVYDPEQAGFEAIVRRLFPDEDDASLEDEALSLPINQLTSTR